MLRRKLGLIKELVTSILILVSLLMLGSWLSWAVFGYIVFCTGCTTYYMFKTSNFFNEIVVNDDVFDERQNQWRVYALGIALYLTVLAFLFGGWLIIPVYIYWTANAMASIYLIIVLWNYLD